MPEKLHPRNRADAAAQDCGEKQGFFRDTPFFVTGFVFIRAHQQKRKDVHKYQIAEQQAVCFHKYLHA